MRDDVVLAVATSFLYGHGGREYLVTARHNATGLNAETGQALLPGGSVPNQLELTTVVPATVRATDPELMVTGQGRRIRLDALDGDGTELHVFGHPSGAEVDVVCIGPFEKSEEMITRAVNDEFYDLVALTVRCGDDAFVLGYPHFVDGGASFLPIWKRASIASDPRIAQGPGRRPRVLVDTATRPGMSGGPVFVRQSGLIIPGPPYQRDQLVGDEILGTAQNFLGCYAGRLGEKDQLDSQLGIVWTRRAIEETIEAGQALDPAV
jgi:hypothetical protein